MIRAIGVEVALVAAVEGVDALELAIVAGALSPTAAAIGQRYLILVGELPVEAVDGALARVQIALTALGPPGHVELAFYRPADWRTRRETGNAFVAGLLADPLFVLVGRLA